MIRTIKFRAKDITNNWCYGQLIIGNNYDFIITESDYDEAVATLSTLVCQCHPIKKGSQSIGQFTGRKDKNGKEIYEGDIAEWAGHKMKVIWGEITGCGYGFTWIPANEDIDSYCESMTGFIDEYEVIGNIYDNPELLLEV